MQSLIENNWGMSVNNRVLTVANQPEFGLKKEESIMLNTGEWKAP